MRLQNIDPSIRRAATSLVVEGMDAIEAALLDGAYFYTARARFLEANADKWVRLYGREAADGAVRAICALDKTEMLSRTAKGTLAQRWKADRLEFLAKHDTTRNTWINRTWIHLFGERLY